MWRVALVLGGVEGAELEEGEEDETSTICAFCLMTSAGVRMAHETSSASDEAAAWMTGLGSSVPLRVVERDVRRAFACS